MGAEMIQDARRLLSSQRRLQVRQEMVLLEPRLQFLELAIRPVVFGQAFPNGLNGKLNAREPDGIRH